MSYYTGLIANGITGQYQSSGSGLLGFIKKHVPNPKSNSNENETRVTLQRPQHKINPKPSVSNTGKPSVSNTGKPSVSPVVETVSSLQDQLRVLKSTIEEKNFELQESKREFIKLKEEMELQLRQIKRENSEVKNLQDALKNAESEIMVLRDAVKREKTIRMQEKKGFMADNVTLRARLDRLQTDYDEYLQKIAALRESDDSIRVQLSDEMEQKRNLIDKVEFLEHKVAELEKQIIDLHLANDLPIRSENPILEPLNESSPIVISNIDQS